MNGINAERPWLPPQPDDPAEDDFDPLDHAGVQPSGETPMVVTPRGGAREVGRSCYQVDTQYGTYLVDCGLAQGGGERFPTFRGLDYGAIDAVLLTHAHIDHSGGLPVLAAEGYLSEDAPIVATRPTIDLATLLLEDSLTLHRRDAERRGEDPRFTRPDVDEVLDRFEAIDYGGGKLAGFDGPSDKETAVFQYGNAAHILGSAWVALQAGGHRVVFSGDIGGRFSHLPDLQAPPEAELLILESTYGGTHTHPSLSGAQKQVWKAVRGAMEQDRPVLIPTFSVGRAQMLSLLLRQRAMSNGMLDDLSLVLDGMAQEATDIYHEYVEDDTYIGEAILNQARESGITEPFVPPAVEQPADDRDRKAILNRAVTDNQAPVILAPSGMLVGGHSPRYLGEFAARFGDARVLLTGYQAKNTLGRSLQNQLRAGTDPITVTTDAEPFGTDWPASEDVQWIRAAAVDSEDDRGRDVEAVLGNVDSGAAGGPGAETVLTRLSVPSEWVEQVGGLSAHADQQGLRGFCKQAAPPTVALIHGPDRAQAALAEDLVENVASVEEATRTRLLTPIAVERDIDIPMASLTEAIVDGDSVALEERVETLAGEVAGLSEEVAAVRDGAVDEATVRRILREELQTLVESGELGDLGEKDND